MRNLYLFLIIFCFLFVLTGKIDFARAAPRIINFSGYDWTIKSGHYGPGPNYWSNDNSAVFVDSQGRLHLKVTKRDGKWYSSEVYLSQSLGYGLYSFDIASRVDLIDKNLVAAPFLYQDDVNEYDIEFSRWKISDGPNASFAVQPYTNTGNISQFFLTLQDGASTHAINWMPEEIAFVSLQNGVTLKQWSYNGANNFTPGAERVHINFWMIDGSAPSDGQEKELIINSFIFKPLAAAGTVALGDAKTTVFVPLSMSNHVSIPAAGSVGKLNLNKARLTIKKQVNQNKYFSGRARNVWTNIKKLRYSF